MDRFCHLGLQCHSGLSLHLELVCSARVILAWQLRTGDYQVGEVFEWRHNGIEAVRATFQSLGGEVEQRFATL
jgi:hypothetical protein